MKRFKEFKRKFSKEINYTIIGLFICTAIMLFIINYGTGLINELTPSKEIVNDTSSIVERHNKEIESLEKELYDYRMEDLVESDIYYKNASLNEMAEMEAKK